MLKNWFLLASVSCGVGFGSTFVISRNLQQSAWAGLGTVPAVATSLTLLSRQRKQEIERQVAKSRSSLDDIRQQEQLVKNSCREISVHGQNLQTGFTQLRQDVDRYRERQVELEREINSLVLQKQTQESLLVQLEAQVTNKQNNLEKINDELAQSESNRKLAIDSAQRSELTFANTQEKIRQDSAIQEQLKVEITDLQNQEENLQAEIASHQVALTESQQQLFALKEQQEIISIAIDGLERSVKDRQSLSNELELEILNRRQIKEDINSQITELEESIFLVSGHKVDEVVNISVTTLYQQWQSVNRQLSELKEQTSQLTQKKDLIQAKRWQENLIFENNPHLQILEHIDRHEVITESEVNNLLGSPRASRQFATRLRDYSPYLPFSVRVEASTSGSRYVKAIITIAKSQNSSDVSQPNVVELELPHREIARYIPELEEQAIQDLTFDLESQSNDDSIERINIYNTCRSCGNVPIRGHDYCYRCN